RFSRDWSSDVCSSDLTWIPGALPLVERTYRAGQRSPRATLPSASSASRRALIRIGEDKFGLACCLAKSKRWSSAVKGGRDTAKLLGALPAERRSWRTRQIFNLRKLRRPNDNLRDHPGDGVVLEQLRPLQANFARPHFTQIDDVAWIERQAIQHDVAPRMG